MKRQPPDFSVIIIEFRMERVMMAVETRQPSHFTWVLTIHTGHPFEI